MSKLKMFEVEYWSTQYNLAHTHDLMGVDYTVVATSEEHALQLVREANPLFFPDKFTVNGEIDVDTIGIKSEDTGSSHDY